MLKIYFTEIEQTNFLSLRGWEIFQESKQILQHAHGSKYLESSYLVWFAQKNGLKLELAKAFEVELKRKLLAL